MKRFLGILSLVFGALSSVTFAAGAADLPSTKSAPAAIYAPPLFTWTGFYVGGSVGYAATHNTVTHYSAGSGCWWSCSNLNGKKDSGQGAIFGLNAGYNYQIGSVVVGLETDISAQSGSGSFNQFCTSLAYCDYTQRNRVSALGTVRGRVGYAFDRALLYVTGGLAYGHVNNYVKDNNDAGYWNGSKWRAGYTLGAGLEYAITNNWSVKAEGLYYDLGRRTLTFVDPASTTSIYPARFKTTGVIARLGVNYKF